MRFFCTHCNGEIHVSKPHPGGWVRCWQCHRRIDATEEKFRSQTALGIHPVLAKRYGAPTEVVSDRGARRGEVKTDKPSEAELALPTIPGYEVMSQIGKGAMGSVYFARQEKSGRKTAIKVLTPELAKRDDLVARFEREAAALKSFRHENVVAIYDSGSCQEMHYFCMEFIHGTTLRRKLSGSPLKPALAIQYVKAILSGIEVMHERGIIHRDLKPENVLIEYSEKDSGKKERVVLVDFGLAGISSETVNPHPNLTHSRVTMGTLNYMAPEQHVDAKRVDFRTDLYACGVILYECLTGDVPLGRFQMPTEKGVSVPVSLDKCLVKVLAREPNERFQSAKAFKEALVQVEAELASGESFNLDLQVEEALQERNSEAEEPSFIQSVAERLTRIPGVSKLSGIAAKPKLVWGISAMLLGIIAGVLIANQPPKEILVTKDAVKPVLTVHKLKLPGLRDDTVAAAANTLLFNTQSRKNQSSWKSNSPAWGAQSGSVDYVANQTEGKYLRRDLSLLHAKQDMPFPEKYFSAKLTLKPFELPLNSAKLLHKSRELLGEAPSRRLGGVLMVSDKQTEAVGLLRSSNGKCQLVYLADEKGFMKTVSSEEVPCKSTSLGSVELGISCSKEGECSALVGGKKQTSLLLNKDMSLWHPAFACQNIDCQFKI